MDLKLILSVSSRHLLSRKKQSIIAALGVTFGIGTFITLVSFMTGLNGLLDGLVLNRTPHVHLFNELKASEKQPVDYISNENEFNVIHSIKPKVNQLRINNALAIIDYLNQDQRVLGAIPQNKIQVFYRAGSVNLNGILNGVLPIKEHELFRLGDYIVEGSLDDLKNTPRGIVLGAGVAQKLKLKLGDRIHITSTVGGQFQLKIVGIYQSGLAEVDDVQSYINISMAQSMAQQADNYITDIHIKLHDINLSPEMAKQFASQFKVSAVDINTINAQFETGTSIRNIITYSVSITLLIVAGFGIYNILNMLIYEKMDDIAILKAVGFSGQDVYTIFISQAIIIGFIGGVLGLLLGFLLSVLINQTPFETEALPTIKTFPVNFNIIYYLIGAAFALLATFVAGYLPAKKAKAIDPVEIIRGQ